MRSLILLLLVVAMGFGVVLLLTQGDVGVRPAETESEASEARLLSLSPNITEVIVALGEKDQVVGISDYCPDPSAGAAPRVGTSLAPNFEAIARLQPDMIITQHVRNAPLESLAELAPVQELPWLTVSDMANSIRRIGMTTGRPKDAENLAEEIETTLGVPFPVDGPSVLFALEHSPGQLTEVIYVRDDSIHGHALRAAGARNAQPGAPAGVPRISVESILAVNPSGIIILTTQPLDADESRALLDDWRELTPLVAVRKDRLAVVDGRGFSTGPAVLDVAEDLRAIVDEWTEEP